MSLQNRTIYLHGDLDLDIIEARNLPNMDLCSERFRRVVSVISSCSGSVCAPFTNHHHHHHDHSNKHKKTSTNHPHHVPKPRSHQSSLSSHSHIITSDPYVNVNVSGATVARTRVISNCANPVWDEHFNIPLAHPTSKIEFVVKDNDLFGADYIGTATIPTYRIASGECIDEWLTIYGYNGKPAKAGATIHIRLRFIPCEKNPRYKKNGTIMNSMGIDHGVERSYFPMRHGGAVTLYQDAHVEESDAVVKGLELKSGVEYTRESCWEDICHAILEAHHMVYIVGWSIYHKVKLVRGEGRRKLPREGEWSLGDLLKYKSQEGVRVLLLVWDDKTSHNKFYLKTEGLMQTHDEETKKFFKHSSVICKLSPRYASNKLSIIKQQVVGTLYTHHQKCVIVDTQAEGNNRKLTTFLGGLDLCDGRYDTPEHRLFRDLDTTFQNDFHNPSIPVGAKGPRQPWHDLHCKIEGPAAYDVLKNFEQRWRKATKWSQLRGRFKGRKNWQDDSLLKVERISWILSPSKDLPDDDPKLWVRDETDPENWHVQIFRSIDSGSVKGFPTDVKQAEDMNLVCAKDLVIDRSIQTAYVEAIRSAEHFIYIENQYFIGSSYAWPNYEKAGADNLIPMELALKIVNKIRAKERFSVYIVIPMWPEGDPSSASVQEILFWQSQTMQMMYQLIAKELKLMKIEGAHPLDYLNFYCLGSREAPQEGHDSYYAHGSQKHGRFMVYVHAKGMIVDDEYVLLGSANINQRSLAGQRDTEIAMGAYQPCHTWDTQKQHPRGQVYGYRMSLWAEHMGEVDDDFKEAGSLECVQKVNMIAEDNWNKYVHKNYSPLKGHLLKYPVTVDLEGKVDHLPGWEHFPDFDGKILGAPKAIPDALTT